MMNSLSNDTKFTTKLLQWSSELVTPGKEYHLHISAVATPLVNLFFAKIQQNCAK